MIPQNYSIKNNQNRSRFLIPEEKGIPLTEYIHFFIQKDINSESQSREVKIYKLSGLHKKNRCECLNQHAVNPNENCLTPKIEITDSTYKPVLSRIQNRSFTGRQLAFFNTNTFGMRLHSQFRFMNPIISLKSGFIFVFLIFFFGLSQAQLSNAPCNDYSSWVSTTYTMDVANQTFLGVDNWSNKGNLIDADENNAASWTAVLGGSTWIEARNTTATGGEIFPAGSYAGFVVNDVDLLTLGASMRVTTYSGTTLQEEVTFSNLLNTLLDDGGTRRRIGFVTTLPYNRIRLTVNAGITLVFTANAYYAEVLVPCGGPGLVCNHFTPWNRNDYGAIIIPARTGLSGVSVGSMENVNAVTNSFSHDSAIINLNVGVLASASISVRNLSLTYAAGHFAGFEVKNNSLLEVDLLQNTTIRTYLNDVLVETTDVDDILLDVPLFEASGKKTIGFVTTADFDEIRITISQPVGVSLGTTYVYNAVVKQFCTGPNPVCNVQTALTEPLFPALVSPANTGINGGVCVGCSVSNLSYILDSNPDNYGEINLTAGVAVSGSVAVKDMVVDYGVGSFAGFEIRNSTLADVDILNNIVVSTYLSGSLQEFTTTGTLISVGSGLINGQENRILGFITTLPYDEIKISVNQTLALDLGVTRIYRAIVQEFCPGPDLECNVPTQMTNPEYPVAIDYRHTGIDGLVCVGCSIDDADHLINDDLNDYVEIDLLAGVGIQASIAVTDVISDYPQGVFVGFEIENIHLLSADVLNTITITTYLDGSIQEIKSGSNNLVSAATPFLFDEGRRIIGFVTTEAFDVAKLTLTNIVNLDLGTTRVYHYIVQNLCEVELECNQTYFLNNPEFPVLINGLRTGIEGAVCALCAVENPGNVITDDVNDYATITLVAGVLATGSISVQDGIMTYPAGSRTGFVIQDMNTLVQADLFESITLCTYLDGSVQECRSASDLIDLSLLINIFGSGTGFYSIGFRTSLPYDEVRIAANSLASVINVIRVYGAFVDTRDVDDPGFNCCPTTPPTVNANEATNNCPDTFFDLTSLVTETPPANAVLVWFDGNDPQVDNLVADPTLVNVSDTFYAFYYNNVAPNDCYSPPSDSVVVIINPCISNISVADITVNENVGDAPVEICIDQPALMDVTVSVSTTDGTAIQPDDYAEQVSVTATIPAGMQCVTVLIPIVNDGIDENDETFQVVLSNPSANAQIVDGDAVVTIMDNDPMPQMNINSIVVNEDVGLATLTVSLTAVSGLDVSVMASSADNSAVDGQDYTAVSNVSVTILAGQLTATVQVPVIDDMLDEPDESFNVVLSGAVNAVINSGTGVVTIIDNDLACEAQAPVISGN